MRDNATRRGRWRFSIRQWLIAVAALSCILAGVAVQSEFLTFVLGFLVLANAFAWVFIFTSLPRFLFGLRPSPQIENEEATAEAATLRLEEELRNADSAIEKESYAGALEYLERAAAIDPCDLRVILAQTLCFRRTGRLRHAIDVLERASEANPGSALLKYGLACCLVQNGETRPALNALKQALELAPDLRTLAAVDSDLEPLRGTAGLTRALG